MGGCAASAGVSLPEDLAGRLRSSKKVLTEYIQGGDLPGSPKGKLARYFQTGYLAGRVFQVPGYTSHVDRDLSISVQEHRGSGIKVWSEAVDLRAADPASATTVLFHYTGKLGAALLNRTGEEAEMWTSLESREQHFGRGVYACAQDPGRFLSKEDVLLNNHWPCALYPCVNDPSNAVICEQVLSTEHLQGEADYCIPILVPESCIYGLWERPAPDLEGEVGVGCDRWGTRQWPERDIFVIQLTPTAMNSLEVASGGEAAKRTCKKLEALKRAKGLADPDTLTSLHRLVALSRTCPVAVPDAERWVRDELAFHEATRKPLYAGFGTSLVEVLEAKSILLQITEKHQEAETVARRALATSDAGLGSHHPRTCRACNHLAMLLHAGGESQAAKRFCSRAWEASTVALGSRHMTTLAIASNLAEMLSATGQACEAETIFRSVLASRQGTLGPTHVDTVHSSNSLVTLLNREGRYEEAEQLAREALKAAEALGPTHRNTIQALGTLAALRQAMGKHLEAERLYRKALASSGASLGRSHPSTLQLSGKLVEQLQQAGKSAEAERLLWRTVEVQEADLGSGHPETLQSINCLAGHLRATGSTGDGHRAHDLDPPRTRTCCVGKARGQRAALEPLLRRALKSADATLGPTHPATLTVLNNLAVVLLLTQQRAEAGLYLRRAAEGSEMTFGASHPDTVSCYSNLVTVMLELHKGAEAEKLLLEVLERSGLGEDTEQTDELQPLSQLEVLRERAAIAAQDDYFPHEDVVHI